MEDFNIEDLRAMHAVVRTNAGEELYGWFRWTDSREIIDGDQVKATHYAPQLYNAYRNIEDYIALINLRSADTYMFKMQHPLTKDEGNRVAQPVAAVISFPFGFDYLGDIEDRIKDKTGDNDIHRN
jgi:hypothetical protein